MSISLVWIGVGSADGPLLDHAGSQLEQAFGERVERWESDARPRGTLDVARGQHSSREVLRWLVTARPPSTDRVLGVTDVDLFVPVLTFVFGEAQLDGVAAVVSTARLAQGVNRASAALLRVKEIVHEIGHTFGLVHCGTVTCVMARSSGVRSVDAKKAELCPVCRVRYRMFQQEGLHVYREHQNPRR